MSIAGTDRIPLRRALVSVYDKTGLEELVRGPPRRRRGPGVDRRVRRPDRVARAPGDHGGGPHRLPRVPRRPGQDAAPEGARGDPRRPAPRHPRRAARRARRRAVRPRRLQPLPLHRDRDVGGVARRVRRADRHRRPVDGAGRRQEPPVGRHRDLARARTPTCSGPPGDGGFTLAERQALAAEAFVHTATYDVAVASWMGNVLTDTSDGDGFPAWIGATWNKQATAALRREPAPGGRALRQRLPAAARPRPGRAAARQGDVLQQLRRRGRGLPRGPRPRRPADRRDHQARQPVRDRGRRRRGGHRRGPRPGARLRPRVGLRRDHRDEPPGHPRDGRAPSRTSSPRWSSRRTSTTTPSRC